MRSNALRNCQRHQHKNERPKESKKLVYPKFLRTFINKVSSGKHTKILKEIQKSIIKIEGILPLLEKIAFEDNSNMEDVVMKEGNESTNEDSVEAKQLAMGMIGIIKNVKKEK